MKILLVIPRQSKMRSYHLPVGIGYVSASLKRAGHDVAVLNPNHSVEELPLLLQRAIKANNPQVVATGGMAFHLAEIRLVVATARALLPHTVILIGGPVVSNLPEAVMTAVPEADFGVIGEGEHTAVELMSALETGSDLDNVKGLIFRVKETGALKLTAPRLLEENLDALPWVDFEGLGLDIYASLHRPGECAPALIVDSETRVMPLITSRGCPFSCTFCCHDAVGRRYRTRSLDDVFAEITAAIERYHINALFLYEELFCLQRERLEKFCKRVKPLGLRWQCSLRVEQIDVDILKLMKESGCCCIGLGVESMSPVILKSMQKKISPEAIEHALILIYDAKIAVWANLIFGDPAETLATAQESLEWFCNNSRFNLRLAKIGYHPGSRIYDDAVKRGLIKDPINYLLSGNPEINATSMSDDDFKTMSILMKRALFSFGHAGKLLDLKQTDRSSFVARCICPYCGAEGHCFTIRDDLRTVFSINCPICNRAYRVPVVTRIQLWPEITPLLDALRKMEQNGGSADAIRDVCTRILSRDATNNHAYNALIALAEAAGDGMQAINWLNNAILMDPYNPAFFAQMADRLTKMGAYGPREKYIRKAKHLHSVGITGTSYINIAPTQILRQAISLHKAGRLQDAEHLYRSILQAQPQHPDANHNMGVLAVQMKQPSAGLPHLKTALEANPNQGQYWQSYIDALIQTGQPDAARQVLEQGRQRGLQGEAVEALAGRLDHLENATPDRPTEQERAIAYREAGHYKEAAIVLQSWLVNNSQDANAYALLAHVLSLDKQDDPAWVALNAALSINPALPIVQRNHARLLLKQQKPIEALQAAKAAYECDAADPENKLVLAAALGANNQNEQAFPLVESSLQSRPTYAEAFATRALLKLRSGDQVGALADAEKSLSIKPHLGQLWGMVGSLRYQFKDLPSAIDALGKALNFEPDNVEHLMNLGEFKRQAGEVEAAIALLEKAIAIMPGNAGAWVNLGTAFQQAQRISEAKAAYAKALEIAPEQAEVASNLGVLAKGEENWEEALRCFNQALAYHPTRVDIINNRAVALSALERYDEAEQAAHHAIEVEPAHEDAHNILGVIFRKQGRLTEAEASYRRALEIKPDYTEAYYNLGNTLMEQGQFTEAEASYRRALEIKPDYTEAHNNLGITLKNQGWLTAAEASYRRTLEIKPDYAEALNNLGITLKNQGRLTEAEASYRRALEIKPDFAEAHSNLLFCLAFNNATSPEDYISQACAWDLTATTAEERRAARETAFHSPPSQGRRLKIGYVSGDFRQHSVSYFVEKIFCGHNRERFEIFAYSTCPQIDDVTRRLQENAEHWTQLFSLTDAAATERIRQDGVDVLIDLSGHTMHNRLKIFANRSAPVQAHYLGFFASTGLAEMDYWIGDATLIPESETRDYSEKIWRLPRVWINYHAGDAAPPPAWRPDPSGLFWFGSFNNLYKITEESIILWSRILSNCQQGRLLLKTVQFVDPIIRENLLKAFEAHGVPSERISLIGGSVPNWREHMALYDRLDVVLDPVGGVCGGTTTCDALWMGVPVITLAGAGMARRMSASMLTSLGRTEWIVQNADAYVKKAISLAEDVVTRRDLRLHQREEMRRSPLCDSQGLVQALEDAYEKMFELWQETRK